MSSPLLSREAHWMRFVARAVLGGWLLPLFFALFASLPATPAHAQSATQTVVVLDFAVADGLDPLLGRKAADGLAVELQRSGDYDVVTRQRVEDAVGQQAGLQPPYNDTAQVRLAEAVGAKSVFSGRIVGVTLTPGRAARAQIEVRQLDAGTGDYINGTQNIESTEQKLQDVPNETLVDEAINKVVFSAVRSMKQTNLPEGSVLNTTTNDVELSVGARNGVATGQRYSVLRDVFNKAKQITERVKIGEMTITNVESDQATGRLSAGGAAGIRTGDHIREIFVPVSYPLTPNSATGSSSPVTAPPVVSHNGSGGITGIAKKNGKGVAGVLALVGLIGLVGLGGGNSSSSTPSASQPFQATPTSVYPAATFTFSSGFKGLSLSKTLQQESVIGYLIYRGTTPGFTADITNLQAFVDGSNVSSGSSRITFSDPAVLTSTTGVLRRNIDIVSVDSNSTSSGGTGTTGTTGTASVDINITDPGVGTDFINQTQGEVSFEFTQRPLQIGQTYYYKVGRITGQRVVSTNTGGTGTGTSGSTSTQTISIFPVRTPASKSVGGFTPLIRPDIVRDQAQYDTDNFTIRFNFDPTQYNAQLAYSLPSNVNVGTGADQFRVQVSTSTSFSDATTFTSEDLVNPGTTAGGDILLNLGDIRIPNNNGSYIPGQTPLYARVESRNSTDANSNYNRISLPLSLGPATGADSVSRFLAASTGRGGGVNLGLGKGRAAAGTSTSAPRVGKPQ